jgi:hypothetical protein
MSKRSAKADPPATTKRSCAANRQQTTLFKYYEKTSGPSGSSSSKAFVDVTPESLGVKIYTKEEIEASSGLKKTYLLFWNDKARELCQDKGVCEQMRGNKRAFMGAINCSWTIHRTEIIKLQAEEVIELASKVYLDEVSREHKLSSIRPKNISRVNEAHDATCTFYHLLRESDASEIKAMEDDLTKKVHDLKVAQEALLKAIQRKREDTFADQHDRETDSIMAGSPVQLSSDEVEVLVDAVKEEENMLCKDDF